MDQLDLFATPEPEPETEQTFELTPLENYAFLYTANSAGTNSGIRFAATVEDAQKWCSSKLSKGTGMGGSWAYFWTSIKNYIENREGATEFYGQKINMKLKLDKTKDNGEWDQKIASTGCQKIELTDIPALLEPYGIRVDIIK